MKRTLFIIIAIFLFVFSVLVAFLISVQNRNNRLSKINAEYEYYLNKEIYGTELVTLINKAIDNNSKLEVNKDKNGFYIDNGQDSILINIKMIGSNETFQMDRFMQVRNLRIY